MHYVNTSTLASPDLASPRLVSEPPPWAPAVFRSNFGPPAIKRWQEVLRRDPHAVLESDSGV